MTKEDAKLISDALDILGVALVNEDHTWSDEERKLYEKVQRILKKTEREGS